MAAMKPRTSDGPMEAVREGRVIVVRVPLEGAVASWFRLTMKKRPNFETCLTE